MNVQTDNESLNLNSSIVNIAANAQEHWLRDENSQASCINKVTMIDPF